MTRGRGDWILGLIRRTLRLFSLEPQSRSCLLSVGVDHLVDVDPGGDVVVLTGVDILAGVQTSCLSLLSSIRGEVDPGSILGG